MGPRGQPVPGVPGCFKSGFVAINICKSNVKVAILFRAWINYAASKRVPFLFSCALGAFAPAGILQGEPGLLSARHH
jgi:hypothetical protein